MPGGVCRTGRRIITGIVGAGPFIWCDVGVGKRDCFCAWAQCKLLAGVSTSAGRRSDLSLRVRIVQPLPRLAIRDVVTNNSAIYWMERPGGFAAVVFVLDLNSVAAVRRIAMFQDCPRDCETALDLIAHKCSF